MLFIFYLRRRLRKGAIPRHIGKRPSPSPEHDEETQMAPRKEVATTTDEFTHRDYINLGRSLVRPPWTCLEEDNIIVFCKIRLSKLTRVPICTQSLTFDKKRKVFKLERYGEDIPLELLCPYAYRASELLLFESRATYFFKKIFAWDEGDVKARELCQNVTEILSDVTTTDKSAPGALKLATEQILKCTGMQNRRMGAPKKPNLPNASLHRRMKEEETSS